MARKPTAKQPIAIADLTHGEATRKNIPTVEHQPVMTSAEQAPVQVHYPRGTQALQEEKDARNSDLDPQLVWRGKDRQDWSELVVNAPPLYIQEKVKPKALIDELRRAGGQAAAPQQGELDLFSDFNGLPEGANRTEFYHHEGHWQNRFILGDSLQVMASLAEREGLRGKVQCIYFDPPYGIKFNSNFQWSTTSRDVKDGNLEHITREPEQVKAFRDTWRDGIHSYLTYLRDRLTVARDLLTESGAIFVQIGDENVHRVRAVMDEVFGDENFCGQIGFQKTSGAGSPGELLTLAAVNDYLLWYAKDFKQKKFRHPMVEKVFGGEGATAYRLLRNPDGSVKSISPDAFHKLTHEELRTVSRIDNLTSQSGVEKTRYPVIIEGETFTPNRGVWKTSEEGMQRLLKASRVAKGVTALGYVRQLNDFSAVMLNNSWTDTTISGSSNKVYVVQTSEKVVQRCILMSTDPGDLVLDPTCGSGTTAYVAEQWGRRWITVDTSRVALALARARTMGARYPFYLLADSKEGQQKEAEITRSAPSSKPTYGNVRLGFVYERVPHITLKSIANNAEIDVIWEKFEAELAPLREQLTEALPKGWLAVYRKAQKYTAAVPEAIQEWEVPRRPETAWPDPAARLFERIQAAREAGDEKKAGGDLKKLNEALGRFYTLANLPEHPADPWPEEVASRTAPLIEAFWKLRIERQQEIDASIAAKAEFEYLYDKPYEDRKTVRVAGPFTVESLSPHRVLGVDEDGELIDGVAEAQAEYGRDFNTIILETLKTAGVQQAHKADKIEFTALEPWPGEGYVCAVGTYLERGQPRRAGIFIGPEFGTVSRQDLVAAAREAGDAGLDVLIACAFNFDAMSTEFDKLGRITVLKARMNADLHMAEDLKNTGKGNLFVIFGEPDVDILDARGHSLVRHEGGRELVSVPVGEEIRVQIRGVDVFHPNTGEVRSDGPEGIACWFIDTDYNEESFFVRHAYFLGANDPYKALKTTLKAEIDEAAWATLHSDISRPFPKPSTGRIAVKVINHLGDEVMKVFRVE